jgi:hypothetical protein
MLFFFFADTSVAGEDYRIEIIQQKTSLVIDLIPVSFDNERGELVIRFDVLELELAGSGQCEAYIAFGERTAEVIVPLFQTELKTGRLFETHFGWAERSRWMRWKITLPKYIVINVKARFTPCRDELGPDGVIRTHPSGPMRSFAPYIIIFPAATAVERKNKKAGTWAGIKAAK